MPERSRSDSRASACAVETNTSQHGATVWRTILFQPGPKDKVCSRRILSGEPSCFPAVFDSSQASGVCSLRWVKSQSLNAVLSLLPGQRRSWGRCWKRAADAAHSVQAENFSRSQPVHRVRSERSFGPEFDPRKKDWADSTFRWAELVGRHSDVLKNGLVQ